MVFKPHWFMQVQAGAAHTLGEAKFSDLISPAAAVNVGYQFAPAWRVRVGASGWQAKGRWVSPQQDYQYKYLQGSADIISDLSTLFCGFNPKRVFNGYAFVGVGLNHALIMMKLMLLIREAIKWNIYGKTAKLRIRPFGLRM